MTLLRCARWLSRQTTSQASRGRSAPCGLAASCKRRSLDSGTDVFLRLRSAIFIFASGRLI